MTSAGQGVTSAGQGVTVHSSSGALGHLLMLMYSDQLDSFPDRALWPWLVQLASSAAEHAVSKPAGIVLCPELDYVERKMTTKDKFVFCVTCL